MPYVANSEIHGLGVFADRDYAQGDTIELCPYLVADYTDVGDECVLHDYMFHTPYIGEEQYYIPLGHATATHFLLSHLGFSVHCHLLISFCQALKYHILLLENVRSN